MPTSADQEPQSPEYHAAHLAFSRLTIVDRAVHGEQILDLLIAYTEDVAKAERETANTTLKDRVRDLETAISEHRATIVSVGYVHVSNDESRARAERKQAADLELWDALPK